MQPKTKFAKFCRRSLLQTFSISTMLLAVLAGPASAQNSPCSVDTTAPVITGCPSNIIVQTGSGNTTGSKTATWTAPTASDNCSAVTATSTHQPGATFSKGITEVTYTFTDAAHNTSSCTFYVTVEDNTPPVISALSDIIVNNATGECGARVSYTKPTYTDNCPLCISSIEVLENAGFKHLGTFRGHDYYRSSKKADWDKIDSLARSIGGYLATISDAAEDSFIDASNNQLAWMGLTDRDSEGVWVWANGEPVTYRNWCYGQPDDWLIDQNYGILNSFGLKGPDGCWDDGHSPGKSEHAIVNNIYGIIETVSCGSITRTAGLDSGAVFPVGTTVVTWTAKDATGNIATRSFNVTVIDNEAPLVFCPPNRAVAYGGNTTPTVSGTGIARATDNCSTPAVSSTDTSTRSNNPAAADYYNYTISRTWTASDAANNKATCTQIITVADGTPPNAICKNTTVFLNSAGAASIVPADINNGSNDAQSAVTLVSVQPNTFSCAQAGTAVPVVLTVRDVAGNTATCTSNVTVRDNTHPVITCPANITVNYPNAAAPTAAGTGIASASDNCGSANISSTDVSTKGNNPNACSYYTYKITRTWKATDASNNSATCSQEINVQDVTPPNAVCRNISVTLGANGTASITPTAVNNGSSDAQSPVTLVSVVPNTFTAAQAGQNVSVVLTVADVCGNTSTCTSTVTVVDNTPPSINCPAPVTVSCDKSTAPAATGTATGTDNCGSATITYSDVSTKSANPASCGYYSYTITRTWKATDKLNNSSTCTQLITVKDNTAPVAICKSKSITLVNGTATITPADINNGSYDNCSPIASVTLSKSTFTCANIGSNQVTMTVTDVCGNKSTCTTTVNVSGASCNCSIAVTPSSNIYTGGVPTNIYLGYGPQKATLTANSTGSGPFTYSWSGPTSKLSCTTCKSPEFKPTAAGTYTYTVTIRNSFGCTSTCSVTFCVKDIRVSGSSNEEEDEDDDRHCSSNKKNNKYSHDYCDSDDDDDNNSSNKVYICHVPPGNPSNAKTHSISLSAVPAHLANHSGDRLGKCNQICGTNARMMAEEVVTDEVKVYPNPNNGSFIVELPYIEDKALIVITDVQGRIVRQKVVVDGDESKVRFDLGSVARGIYLVDVSNGEHKFRTKLVIQ